MRTIIEEGDFLKDKTNGDILFILSDCGNDDFWYIILQEPNEWFEDYLDACDFDKYIPSQNDIDKFNSENEYLKRKSITLSI